MGWHIDCLDNDLRITKECALELHKTGTKLGIFWGDDLEEVRDPVTGLIEFDSDAMEHMDYLHYEEVQEILLKHKVNGRVLWTSADGDNAGQNWGYEFTEGVCKLLTGTVSWS